MFSYWEDNTQQPSGKGNWSEKDKLEGGEVINDDGMMLILITP